MAHPLLVLAPLGTSLPAWGLPGALACTVLGAVMVAIGVRRGRGGRR